MGGELCRFFMVGKESIVTKSDNFKESMRSQCYLIGYDEEQHEVAILLTRTRAKCLRIHIRVPKASHLVGYLIGRTWVSNVVPWRSI